MMTEALGAPAFTDLEEVLQKLGPKQIRLILWAGLLHKFPELSQKDVVGIINEYLEDHDIGELSEVVIKALAEASILGGGSDQGEVKEKAKKPAKISET